MSPLDRLQAHAAAYAIAYPRRSVSVGVEWSSICGWLVRLYVHEHKEIVADGTIYVSPESADIPAAARTVPTLDAAVDLAIASAPIPPHVEACATPVDRCDAVPASSACAGVP